jgi:hypothetical protein
MANLSAPIGLKPVKNFDGTDYTGASAVPCVALSSYATALYIGDPVIVTGTANTAEILTSGEVGGGVGMPIGSLPTVERATNGDGNRITGVVTRVGFDANDYARSNYRKASTSAVVWVEMNPDTLFEIQASTTVAVTDVGLNANLTGTGGSTVTGISAVQLDSSAMAADASNQLLIVGVSRDMDRNDLSSSEPCVYVKLNQRTHSPDSVLGI